MVLEEGRVEEKDEEEERDVDTTAVRAQARSDMFHQYLKLKRSAKIKSKKYHKLKRKAAGKAPEADQEEEEMARAQERISQRHSVAKRLKRSLKYSRRESNMRDEALTANALLAQRIKHPSHLTSDGQIAHNSDSAEDSEAEIVLPAPEDAKSGVMALKFMQEAMKRDRKEMDKKDDFETMDEEKPLSGKMTFKGNKSKDKSEDETVKKRKITDKLTSEIASKRQETLIDQAFNMTEMDEVAAEEWQQENPATEVQDTGLKGWGSWFGSGISLHSKADSVAILPKIACEKVIKHTERVKSAAKYMVKRLPFPYTTREQFDTGHKIPIGKDWNTQRTHQKLIAKEVVARAGEMIAPIRKPEED
jgi:U3 small nucleolar RNA-associated protein 14